MERLKASEEDWKKATENLNARRKAIGFKTATTSLAKYREHLDKCGFGSSILDVGCGSQQLKEVLPENVKYFGLDAFPLEGFDCIETPIEDLKGWTFDTVVAFAVLDNCLDFKKACEVIKESARKNIIILTGINLEVDEFHTFKLQHSDFEKAFLDCKLTVKEELTPNVWLLNYQK